MNTESIGNAQVVPMTFTSDDAQLAAKFLRPAIRHTGSQPLVVVATGDGPRGSYSSSWPVLVSGFLDAGCAVFIFDFQSQGDSKWERTDLNLSHGCRNLKDAITTARNLPGMSDMGLAVFGSSFGGAAAIEVVASMPEVNGLLLKSPATFLAEAYEHEHEGFTGLKQWQQDGVSAVNTPRNS